MYNSRWVEPTKRSISCPVCGHGKKLILTVYVGINLVAQTEQLVIHFECARCAHRFAECYDAVNISVL